jgi:hypothetical protein
MRECILSLNDTNILSSTITDWFNFCREVCVVYLDCSFVEEGQIEGTNCFVKIE